MPTAASSVAVDALGGMIDPLAVRSILTHARRVLRASCHTPVRVLSVRLQVLQTAIERGLGGDTLSGGCTGSWRRRGHGETRELVKNRRARHNDICDDGATCARPLEPAEHAGSAAQDDRQGAARLRGLGDADSGERRSSTYVVAA